MIGSFGRIIFKVSEKQVASINNQLSREYKSKMSEHTAIYGPGKIRHQGRELSEVSLNVTLISSLITETSLSEQLNDIKTMWEFGEYEYLTFGGQTFGAFPFIITGMSEKSSYFNKEAGVFDVVELDLTLKEYIEEPRKYNQIIEQLKIQDKQQEQITEEAQEVVEIEQKSKIEEFAKKVGNKVNSTLERVNKAIEIAENKKNEKR